MNAETNSKSHDQERDPVEVQAGIRAALARLERTVNENEKRRHERDHEDRIAAAAAKNQGHLY